MPSILKMQEVQHQIHDLGVHLLTAANRAKLPDEVFARWGLRGDDFDLGRCRSCR
jgi:hypothetical protein